MNLPSNDGPGDHSGGSPRPSTVDREPSPLAAFGGVSMRSIRESMEFHRSYLAIPEGRGGRSR